MISRLCLAAVGLMPACDDTPGPPPGPCSITHHTADGELTYCEYFSYDSWGSVTRIDHDGDCDGSAESTETYRYTRDRMGRIVEGWMDGGTGIYEDGRLIRVDFGGHSNVYTYDAAGRLIREESDEGTYVTTYTYDEAGCRVGVNDFNPGDHFTETCTCDAEGRVVACVDDDSGWTETWDYSCG